MALPPSVTRVVLRDYWLDEDTGLGMRDGSSPATVTLDPIPLGTATGTPNLRDYTGHAFLKTRPVVATVDQSTGYWAALVVASDDPDLDAYAGRRVTFLGEAPFLVAIPYLAPEVTVDAEMAAAIPDLMVGETVRALWLDDAAVIGPTPPSPSASYYTTAQTLSAINTGLDLHDEDPAAHPDIRADLAALPFRADNTSLTGAAVGRPSALLLGNDAKYTLLDLDATVDELSCWGESLTASVGTDWPAAVGTALGITAVNNGVSGQASSDVALRQGGLAPKLTVTANQIPASGPVTVTALNPSTSYRVDGTGAFSFTGTLAGVPGTLTHDMSAATWVFTRTASGSAVSCPSGTPFLSTTGDVHRRRIATLWVGRNNLTTGGPVLADVVRDTDLMIRNMVAEPGRRYLVLGVTNAATETRNSANWTAITALNAALALRHPTRFVDVRAWLIANGLALAGITPTIQDLADLANDVLPSSLRIDAIHLTAAGYTLVGQLAADKIRALGWIPGQLPAVVPGQVVGGAAGTATTSTQPLTWTALTGAAAYTVEYRAAGATPWLLGGHSTTASLTVTGLSAGTSYEYRVTPRNIAGTGTPSATVTASTAGTPPTVITSDSFNRADATGSLGTSDAAAGGTGAAWTVQASAFSISSNQAKVLSAPSTNRPAHLELGQTDVAVYAKIPTKAASAGQTVGVIARCASDASTYYFTDVTPTGALALYKRSGSSIVLAGPYAANAGPTDVIGCRVRTSGANAVVEALFNGTVVLSATDTSPLTGTRGGLRSAFSETSAFDDFLATTV